MTALITGYLAMFSTILFSSIGLPNQIIKNFKNKSVEGLSILANFLSFTTFFLWEIYGLAISDIFIISSNLPGIFCMGIILIQFRLYRIKQF